MNHWISGELMSSILCLFLSLNREESQQKVEQHPQSTSARRERFLFLTQSHTQQEWEFQPLRRTYLCAGHRLRLHLLLCNHGDPAHIQSVHNPTEGGTHFHRIHTWGCSVSSFLHTSLGNTKIFYERCLYIKSLLPKSHRNISLIRLKLYEDINFFFTNKHSLNNGWKNEWLIIFIPIYTGKFIAND